jgi:hypothetical protein
LRLFCKDLFCLFNKSCSLFKVSLSNLSFSDLVFSNILICSSLFFCNSDKYFSSSAFFLSISAWVLSLVVQACCFLSISACSASAVQVESVVQSGGLAVVVDEVVVQVVSL